MVEVRLVPLREAIAEGICADAAATPATADHGMETVAWRWQYGGTWLYVDDEQPAQDDFEQLDAQLLVLRSDAEAALATALQRAEKAEADRDEAQLQQKAWADKWDHTETARATLAAANGRLRSTLLDTFHGARAALKGDGRG